jgi:Zn-dependent protease
MRWSWKLGELAGIDLRVHAAFLLLPAWVGLRQVLAGHGSDGVVTEVGFVLALFACVVLHELGHALAARRYGIGTRDITLLPIGGVARLESIPTRPSQEIVVALAGPAVNVVLAAAGFVMLSLAGPEAWLQRLVIANISLVLFNLIPAFPMDGGRVLRALLAMRMDRVRATGIAARIAQGFAAVAGVVGLFGNPTLLVLAVFVWMQAESEAGQVRLAAAEAVLARPMRVVTVRALAADATLGDGVRLVLTGPEQEFPVMQRGEVKGFVRRRELLAALARYGYGHPVQAVMQ